MVNYKLILEYNGAAFAGSQIQPSKRTIQAELEQALNLLLGPNGSFYNNSKIISTNFSSRTDAGVHALGQVVSFELDKEITEDDYRILAAINANLATDMVVAKIEEVDNNFHPRFDAKAREYLYKIFIRRHRPVLRLDSMMWQKEPLDFEKMARHAKSYLGEQDFSRFAKMSAPQALTILEDQEKNKKITSQCVDGAPHKRFFETEVEDSIITPREFGDSGICNVIESEMIQESKICFKYKIKANRFLRHMVRRLVGELIQVGQGETANDQTCKQTAPAEGLCLVKVEY